MRSECRIPPQRTLLKGERRPDRVFRNFLLRPPVQLPKHHRIIPRGRRHRPHLKGLPLLCLQRCDAQLERMRSSDLDVRERVAAGNALAQQGDPRFRADAWYLPDEPLLGFVEIPAGPFLMGSDKAHDPGAFDDELPQHEVTLPRYFIGRYPVTVAQFRAFVEGRGSRPENPESVQGFANHPVVFVSWYEAQHYCDWLTERLRAWPGTPEPLASSHTPRRLAGRLAKRSGVGEGGTRPDGRIYPWE